MGLTNGSHGFQPFSPFGTFLLAGRGTAQPPFNLGIKWGTFAFQARLRFQGNTGIPSFSREPEKDLHFSRRDFGRDIKGKPVICRDFYCLFYGHGLMILQNLTFSQGACASVLSKFTVQEWLMSVFGPGEFRDFAQQFIRAAAKL
jgi:hypothetical protein